MAIKYQISILFWRSLANTTHTINIYLFSIIMTSIHYFSFGWHSSDDNDLLIDAR